MSEKKLPPVYKLTNGRTLNKLEYLKYFEEKVFKTLRTHKLLEMNDIVVVAVSGGKDSITALYLMKKYMSERNKQGNLRALLIDEGIAGYRPKTIEFTKQFCEKEQIPLTIKSYKELFNTTLDQAIKKLKESNVSACNICGTFRRAAINLGARELKGTKVVTGHNLDDEAQSILLNIFKNNYEILSRLGPFNGTVRTEKFVPRIKPLYLVSEKEVRLYTIIKGWDIGFDECPYSKETFRRHILDMLNKLEDEHKGIKHGIVNFYLETQDALKQKFIKEHGSQLTFCTQCGEPSQKKICNTCEFIKKLN